MYGLHNYVKTYQILSLRLMHFTFCKICLNLKKTKQTKKEIQWQDLAHLLTRALWLLCSNLILWGQMETGRRDKKPIVVSQWESLDLDQVFISGLLQFQIYFESKTVDLLMNWKGWETKKEVKNGPKFWPEQIKQRMK